MILGYSDSVLDWKPRVITMALHKRSWIAYSTENAALFIRCGKVPSILMVRYIHAHGPQPISIGDAYQVNAYKTLVLD